jgi:hypothetical protein
VTSQPVLLVGSEQEIPLDCIVHGVKFRGINPAKVAEIHASLPEQGLLYAIIVKPANPEGFYEISDGHHRYEACKKEGWATIRSRIGSADKIMAGMQGIVGNICRNEEKNYTLLGDWFREAIQAPGWDLARVAKTTGKTTDFIERCIKRSEAIDPKLHGQFSQTIPRTLTDDFARIPREKQETVFEKIKKRKAVAYLSTQSIRQIISDHVSVVAQPTRQVHLCQRCGGILDKAEIEAGEVFSVPRDSGLEYTHKYPENCHFTTTFIVTYTGKVPKAEVQEQIGFFREKLEELGATITVYGRSLRKTK